MATSKLVLLPDSLVRWHHCSCSEVGGVTVLASWLDGPASYILCSSGTARYTLWSGVDTRGALRLPLFRWGCKQPSLSGQHHELDSMTGKVFNLGSCLGIHIPDGAAAWKQNCSLCSEFSKATAIEQISVFALLFGKVTDCISGLGGTFNCTPQLDGAASVSSWTG